MFLLPLFKNKLSKASLLTIEIPLESSSSMKLIPWIIALMIYLSTMALMGGVVAHRWVENERTLYKVDVNNDHSSIKSKTSHSQLARDLPSDFQKGRAVLFLTFGILALIATSCVLTVAFITHAGLIIHKKVIDILKILGAQDRFIADQFQHHSFLLALKGTGIGTTLSWISFLYSYPYVHSLGSPLNQGLKNELWLILVLVPFLMIGTVMITARSTVLLALQDEV